MPKQQYKVKIIRPRISSEGQSHFIFDLVTPGLTVYNLILRPSKSRPGIPFPNIELEYPTIQKSDRRKQASSDLAISFSPEMKEYVRIVAIKVWADEISKSSSHWPIEFDDPCTILEFYRNHPEFSANDSGYVQVKGGLNDVGEKGNDNA